MESPSDQIAGPDAETAPLRRPSPEITDFPWDSLPSLTERDVETTNRLLRLLPLDGNAPSTLSALGEHIADITDIPHTIDHHRLQVRDPSRPPPTFGDTIATRFHLPPDPETGALLIETSLVDRWLSALGREPTGVRPAGDQDHREFGLATYLVVRAFDWLTAECGAPPVVFPTEPPPRETLQERLDDADRLVDVAYTVTTDRNCHLVRCLIPEGLVRNCEIFHRGDPTRRAVASELLEGPRADLEVDLPVSLGRTRLGQRAFRELTSGDVVLFDEHGYAADAEETDAADPTARLQLADGGSSHLPGVAVPGPAHWQFHPLDLTPRSDDEENDAVSDNADRSSDDNVESGADPGPTDLLETPELQLDARIGSTTLSIRELGDMQPGQVLELETRVGQPVDLVVDDKVVGEGELVEIEGHLGVRVRRMDD